MKGFLIGLSLRLGVWWFGVWRGMYVVLMVCMWHGSDRRICRSFHHTLLTATSTRTPTHQHHILLPLVGDPQLPHPTSPSMLPCIFKPPFENFGFFGLERQSAGDVFPSRLLPPRLSTRKGGERRGGRRGVVGRG